MTVPGDVGSLPKRRLGQTGFEVCPLGLGGAWLGRAESDAAAVAAVRRALDAGINYVDTSPLYGESERILGQALKGGRRERIYLATKTGTRWTPRDYTGEGTRRSVEMSLQALGTDYLDVLLIHDPETLEPAFAPGAALDVIRGMKEAGMVRAIGLGVRSHALLRQAIESDLFDVVLTYLDYNLFRRTAAETILPLAAQRDVGVVLGSPLGMGLLTGPDPAERPSAARNPDTAAAREQWLWAREHGVDLVALAIQFCLREPRVATSLNGARSVAEVDSTISAALTPIPDAVWQAWEAQFGKIVG
jgi:aryl-alcohol dehydrogenase-like predicted oxidoreductase